MGEVEKTPASQAEKPKTLAEWKGSLSEEQKKRFENSIDDKLTTEEEEGAGMTYDRADAEREMAQEMGWQKKETKKSSSEKKTGLAAIVEWFQKTFGEQKEKVVTGTQDQTSILLTEAAEETPAVQEKIEQLNKKPAGEPKEPTAEDPDPDQMDKLVEKLDRTDVQNNIAKEVAAEAAAEHIVEQDETLGAIARGLTGRLDWGMAVDYRSEQLTNKPKVLAEANLIYPGQHVWIEDGKIVVSDEAKQEAENTVVGVSAGPAVSPAILSADSSHQSKVSSPVISVVTGEETEEKPKEKSAGKVIKVDLEGN